MEETNDEDIYGRRKIMNKVKAMAAIKALLVSYAILAIWYALEFSQFGELQWDRKCDGIVWWLYFFVMWYLFAHQK